MTAIAAEVECSEPAARQVLPAAGIARRPRDGQRLYPALTDQAWLLRRNLDGQASVADIAASWAVASTRCAGRRPPPAPPRSTKFTFKEEWS